MIFSSIVEIIQFFHPLRSQFNALIFFLSFVRSTIAFIWCASLSDFGVSWIICRARKKLLYIHNLSCAGGATAAVVAVANTHLCGYCLHSSIFIWFPLIYREAIFYVPLGAQSNSGKLRAMRVNEREWERAWTNAKAMFTHFIDRAEINIDDALRLYVFCLFALIPPVLHFSFTAILPPRVYVVERLNEQATQRMSEWVMYFGRHQENRNQ